VDYAFFVGLSCLATLPACVAPSIQSNHQNLSMAKCRALAQETFGSGEMNYNFCTGYMPNWRLEGVTNWKSHSSLWSMLIWRIYLVTLELYGMLDLQNQKIGIIGVPEENSLGFATKAQVI
jgi:hypothetical protein